jgi:hypothetical protein
VTVTSPLILNQTNGMIEVTPFRTEKFTAINFCRPSEQKKMRKIKSSDRQWRWTNRSDEGLYESSNDLGVSLDIRFQTRSMLYDFVRNFGMFCEKHREAWDFEIIARGRLGSLFPSF